MGTIGFGVFRPWTLGRWDGLGLELRKLVDGVVWRVLGFEKSMLVTGMTGATIWVIGTSIYIIYNIVCTYYILYYIYTYIYIYVYQYLYLLTKSAWPSK